MKFNTLFFVMAIAAQPLSAQSYTAEGGIVVTPVANGFEVASGGGMGARGMWCAAAQYAANVQGLRGIDRIYVASDSAPRGRGGVVFTTDASGLTPHRVMIVGGSIRRAGANLSVDHARSFCADFRIINR